mmetsp:Transcript_2458/g.5631  ORF Transcript_2458/g.5631 Transcript_2458/m.5631 type:complete len:322 (-) Transcript_2458:234-1199(-)
MRSVDTAYDGESEDESSSTPVRRMVNRTSSVWSVSSLYTDGGTVVSEALSICGGFKWRLHEELYLLRQQWIYIARNFVVLFYLTPVLFMNLAFYRYPEDLANKRLPDLGHVAIPEMNSDATDSGLVELPMYVVSLATAVMCLSLFVNNTSAGTRNPKPNLVNVVLRTSTVIALGQTMRGGMYLVTAIPGSADRCLKDAHPEQYKPSFSEIFYKFGDVYHNCGDLMFSGHMLLMLSLTMSLYHYGESAFWISPRRNRALLTIYLLLCVLQTVLILAARHHYTSDVVVAWYISPLLWYYHSTLLHRRDKKPDLDAIAQSVLKV